MFSLLHPFFRHSQPPSIMSEGPFWNTPDHIIFSLKILQWLLLAVRPKPKGLASDSKALHELVSVMTADVFHQLPIFYGHVHHTCYASALLNYFQFPHTCCSFNHVTLWNCHSSVYNVVIGDIKQWLTIQGLVSGYLDSNISSSIHQLVHFLPIKLCASFFLFVNGNENNFYLIQLWWGLDEIIHMKQ